MTEQIGKVTLDLTCYPGEDFYCDGAVEDEILDIVKNCTKEEYQKKIEEKKSWPVFYHLSPQRENIISWLPMDKNTKVLEVGSGMGAITGALARRAGSVTCVDLSLKRSRINAYRNSEYENVTIHVGNFNDIEPLLPCDYDYVLLVGVFEYGQSYIPTKTPFEDFLKINQKHVKPGGRLAIAIENKMGMKYWAGCQEDHLAQFFAGIEDYPNGGGVRTFTRNGLERIFKACGTGEYHFYYPYPDYKFADTIYSDRRLPRVGELSRNLRNFDGDRLLLFDEKNAFDMVIREGLFPLYSNSYMAVIGPEMDTVYSKFSNDRAELYAIRTDIVEKEGKRTVCKHAQTAQAKEHVENIARFCQELGKKYEGSGLRVNACTLEKGTDGLSCACLEYLEGRTLEEMLDECLEAGDEAGFSALFEEYLEKIRYHENVPVSDYDLIFGNIIVDSEGNWNLIDYEWTFDECVDSLALAYRALYCYQMGDGRRKGLDMKPFLERLSITEQMAEEYRARELRFQKAVTGNRVSISDMRVLLGRRVVPWQGMFDQVKRNTVEIFEDYGKGYSAADSYRTYPTYLEADLMNLSLPVKKEVCGLRVDPAEGSCIIRMHRASVGGRPLDLSDKAVLSVNGWELTGKRDKNPVFYFHTNDPNINIRMDGMERGDGETLELEFEINRLTEETAAALDLNLKRRYWF